MKDIVLGREESYDSVSPDVWTFHKVTDVVHGINLRLSNMAGGFPFTCGDILWKDSERLYLCGEYSLDTADHLRIQKELIASVSGYAAKRFVKAKYKKQVRDDFQEFRLQWMLFVVWQKCLGNKDFCQLLAQVPASVTLVENTTTDRGGTATVWGCRLDAATGTWRGENNIGKILMICRDALVNGKAPTIDYDLLRSKQIYLLGHLLTV